MRIVGWPTCSLCLKPVEKVEQRDHPEYFGKIYTVFCHGEHEMQWLTSIDVINADEISFGMAFVKPLITHEQQTIGSGSQTSSKG